MLVRTACDQYFVTVKPPSRGDGLGGRGFLLFGGRLFGGHILIVVGTKKQTTWRWRSFLEARPATATFDSDSQRLPVNRLLCGHVSRCLRLLHNSFS